MLEFVQSVTAPFGPLGFGEEVALLAAMSYVILLKSLYHARIYQSGPVRLNGHYPNWFKEWTEQHRVSISSDAVAYLVLTLLGVNMVATMGAAVLMYAAVFNGFIQMALGNGWWGFGPDHWDVRLFGRTFSVRRYWKARKSKSIAGALLLGIGLLL